MATFNNAKLIELVKDITIAKLSSNNSIASDIIGKDTAEFMQAIYDKLVELNNKDN
nr:MAG TPA: hypothetical protein [Caudoviricetes sp.]